MAPIVIGVSGKIGAGKTTLAEGLELFSGFTVLPLADSVKSGISDMGGQSQWIDKELQSLGGHRKAWQLYGNECRYDLGCPLVWTHQVLMKIRFLNHYAAGKFSRTFDKFVIPDLRHTEESDELFRVVNGWGGWYESWYVSREDRVADALTEQHSSELGTDNIFYSRRFRNDGTTQKLVIDAVAEVGKLIRFRSENAS